MVRTGVRVIPQPVVVSVWHSGTRTLREHLGFDRHQHFVHFHLKPYYSEPHLAHVPIRHPMQVAESWARRGKPAGKLLEQYEAMFEFLAIGGQTLHRVEDLPRLAGTDDLDVVRAGRPALVDIYQRAVAEQVVRAHEPFFVAYYADPYQRRAAA